jgi:hypothetical protein
VKQRRFPAEAAQCATLIALYVLTGFVESFTRGGSVAIEDALVGSKFAAMSNHVVL